MFQIEAPNFSPPGPLGVPSFSFPFPRRATRKELQCHPSPAAETPPLQHRPTVRAAINTVEPAAGRGRPQADPIPETAEMRRPGRAEVCSSTDPTSRDLGPCGPDLASLQAEREVVSEAGLGPGRDWLQV